MKCIRQVVAAAIFIFSFLSVNAQTNYITHTLQQGETLSALAKQYNTTVGDIMRMNGMHADTKLAYGSKIKIPSTKKNVVKASEVSVNVPVKNPPATTTTSTELTHVVMKGETLYSISKKYNVSIDQLKAWNHLADNSTKVGMLLIISEKGSNKLATTTTQKQSTATITTPQTQKEPVAENKPGNTTTPTDDVTNNIQPAMQAVNSMNAPVDNKPEPAYSGEGFFESQFKQKKAKNMQNVSGLSKTFKTASGWSDGKYYILANDIEPGTIVKVTADNGNSVYAKVLWNMGDLKDNAGINFRVSNATAAALHVNDPSFNVNVSF